MTAPAPTAAASRGLTIRPARADDVAACAAIWRISINDYTAHLGQPEIPMELGPITRLYTHLQVSDGERFIVAETRGERPEIVAFTAATVRDRLWYLSMLFVMPDYQGSGLGRELLERILPSDDDVVRAVAGRFPRIDVAVPFAGAARSSLLDGYLTLTSDGAAEPPRSWAAPTVVPAHAEGWGHFTERINEIVAAFTRHGLSDRLRVIAPGDTAAV